MSFLAPLFLLGGLAVAAPILFHYIRRSVREQTPFSSLMFLRASPPRLTRRSRIEHWLLLLLRCLVLALLALAFGRPFLRRGAADAAPAAPGRRRVVLVDVSASMRRTGLWTEARRRAEAAARAAGPGDRLQFMTFARRSEIVLPFSEWDAAPPADRAALAASRLASGGPGWGATRLGDALIGAAEALADVATNAPGPRDVLLVSDLQEGVRLDALQGFDWPKGVTLTVDAVRPPRGNAGLQLAAEASGAAPAAGGPVRVRVSNAPDGARERFELRWALPGGRGYYPVTNTAYVPPGQSRIFAVERPPGVAAADTLVLTGDDEDFDNALYLAPVQPARSTVVYVGSETAADVRKPLFFLRSAFGETARQSVEVRALDPARPVPEAAWRGASLVVLTEPPDAESVRGLRGEVLRGKTVLVAPKTAAMGAALAALLGVERVDLEEGAPGEDALLAEIDFGHPLFALFADPKYSDFSKIRFWRRRKLNAAAIPGARVAARWDRGDPALTEIPVGRGRVLVLASGWNPEDSQLALSSKFVPFLHSLLSWAGAAEPPPAQYLVGDAVPLPAPSAAAEPSGANAPVTVTAPDGSKTILAPGSARFEGTWAPGVYAAESGAETRRFAVTVAPAESRTAPLSADDLVRLGAPAGTAEAAERAALRSASGAAAAGRADLEGRQKLWRRLLAAALAVLLGETLWAGRMTRRASASASMEAAA